MGNVHASMGTMKMETSLPMINELCDGRPSSKALLLKLWDTLPREQQLILLDRLSRHGDLSHEEYKSLVDKIVQSKDPLFVYMLARRGIWQPSFEPIELAQAGRTEYIGAWQDRCVNYIENGEFDKAILSLRGYSIPWPNDFAGIIALSIEKAPSNVTHALIEEYFSNTIVMSWKNHDSSMDRWWDSERYDSPMPWDELCNAVNDIFRRLPVTEKSEYEGAVELLANFFPNELKLDLGNTPWWRVWKVLRLPEAEHYKLRAEILVSPEGKYEDDLIVAAASHNVLWEYAGLSTLLQMQDRLRLIADSEYRFKGFEDIALYIIYHRMQALGHKDISDIAEAPLRRKYDNDEISAKEKVRFAKEVCTYLLAEFLVPWGEQYKGTKLPPPVEYISDRLDGHKDRTIKRGVNQSLDTMWCFVYLNDRIVNYEDMSDRSITTYIWENDIELPRGLYLPDLGLVDSIVYLANGAKRSFRDRNNEWLEYIVARHVGQKNAFEWKVPSGIYIKTYISPGNWEFSYMGKHFTEEFNGAKSYIVHAYYARILFATTYVDIRFEKIHWPKDIPTWFMARGFKEMVQKY